MMKPAGGCRGPQTIFGMSGLLVGQDTPDSNPDSTEQGNIKVSEKRTKSHKHPHTNPGQPAGLSQRAHNKSLDM